MSRDVENAKRGFGSGRDAPKKAKLSKGTFERSENPKGAQAGARNTAFSDEAICAGLDGAANLKIAAPSGGRANRPYQNVRTVARTEDVTLTRHGLSINRKIQRRYHCTTVAHSSNPLLQTGYPAEIAPRIAVREPNATAP